MPRRVRAIDRVVYTKEMRVYALAVWLDTGNMYLTCQMFKDYYGKHLPMATLTTWKRYFMLHTMQPHGA